MREQKKPRTGVLRIVIPLILVAAAGVFLYMENTQRTVKSEPVFQETEVSFTYGFEDKASVYTNGDKSFYLCTKDGIKSVTGTGQIKWDKAYSMLDPVFAGKGGYAAVCDNKGYILYMFGPSGQLYEKKYDYQILSFTVNARGDAGIILKEGEDYRLLVYNESGVTLLEYLSADLNDMPLCLDISSDGRILAVSFLDINEIRIKSRIVFMYTAEEGKNYSKTLISGFECPGQLVPCIMFMDGNKLLYLANDEIGCINVESPEGSKISWKKPLSNKIDSFAPLGGSSFAIAYGEGLQGKDPLPIGSMEVYNLDLYKTGEYAFGKHVTYLSAAGSNLIASDGRNFRAFNQKCSVLWEYTALFDVKKIMFLDRGNPDSVIMQTNINTVVMKRSKAAA